MHALRQSNVGKHLIYHHVLATNTACITVDGVLLSLQRNGYDATPVKEKGGIIELSLGPNKTTVFIDVSDDLLGGIDVAISTRELLEDWVAEGEITTHDQQTARRIISVRHLDHANKRAIKTIVEHLCLISNGREVMTN